MDIRVKNPNPTRRQATLSSGRRICPKCGAKGLGYASHPHAFGYKDYDKAECRYCGTVFKIKSRLSRSEQSNTVKAFNQ